MQLHCCTMKVIEFAVEVTCVLAWRLSCALIHKKKRGTNRVLC